MEKEKYQLHLMIFFNQLNQQRENDSLKNSFLLVREISFNVL